MVYVLYGQPGSGETSLGKLLASHLDTPFIIDGMSLEKYLLIQIMAGKGVRKILETQTP